MSHKKSGNYGYRSKFNQKFFDPTRDNTKKALRQLDVRPSKERGQNFVVNNLVISSIIEFGAPSKDDFLVEIGPGLGALTKALMPYGLKSVIEIEPAFAAQARKDFSGLDVREADARNFDFSCYGQPVTIFSNLPYSISSEMIISLCELESSVVKRVILMLQKEFAQRLCAPIGSKEYGILSVFSQRAAHTQLGPVIPAEYFHPRPNIDSQVLEFHFKTERNQKFTKQQNDNFRKVVRASFAKRRKMILNSLLSSAIAPEENLEKALTRANIAHTSRAQELSYLDFERLAEALFPNETHKRSQF